jgi:hypothetical protein
LTQFDGYIAETYDPQGNAIQPVHLYSNGTTMTAQVQTSTFYDAFGQGGLYTAYGGGYTPADYNPVGFGGQFGYYTDDTAPCSDTATTTASPARRSCSVG